jgi:acyl-CoA thioesterase FadM
MHGGIMVDTSEWLSKKDVIHYEVRIGDINYGGHLGNDRSLVIFHDARIVFLESLGFSEKDIGDHTSIIMSEAHVFFKKEVFLHDVLTVDVTVSGLTTTSFDMLYTVRRLKDNMEVLNGNTRLMAFNYESHKVVRIPDIFKDKVRK